MIRVAFVLPHLRPGGAERCVVNWLGTLDRELVAPSLFLKCVDGAFLDLLPADVVPVSLGGARAALLPAAIGRALADHRIDVAYSATNAVNLALMAARTRARRIVSEHTPPDAYLAEVKLGTLRRLAMRRFYPRADAVAVPTDAIGSDLARVLGVPLATATIANPVVAGPPLPRVAHEGPFRILAAGRLVPAKGFDTLIDACAQLTGAGVQFATEIYGDGPLRAELQASIDAAGLGGSVRLCGHSDLAPAMARADLFVLSSRREGFGNVVIEAMAAGLPVLATRGGGPEALIADRATGWLVAPEDARALAEAIAAIIGDPMRDRVVEPARAIAGRYTVAASTAALEALLTRVAAQRSMAA